jgi:hypothetical protein
MYNRAIQAFLVFAAAAGDVRRSQAATVSLWVCWAGFSHEGKTAETSTQSQSNGDEPPRIMI